MPSYFEARKRALSNQGLYFDDNIFVHNFPVSGSRIGLDMPLSPESLQGLAGFSHPKLSNRGQVNLLRVEGGEAWHLKGGVGNPVRWKQTKGGHHSSVLPEVSRIRGDRVVKKPSLVQQAVASTGVPGRMGNEPFHTAPVSGPAAVNPPTQWKPQAQTAVHSSVPAANSVRVPGVVKGPMPSKAASTVVGGTGEAIKLGKLYSQPEVAAKIEKFMMPQKHAGLHAPGLLGTAIGAAAVGYYAGDQDGWSAAQGVAGGFAGGKLATMGQSYLHNAAEGMIRAETKSAEKMSESAFKAVNIGKMITHAENRNVIFAAGAMLGGAFFSNMFAGNGKTHKSGFNAGRGNSIQR